MASLVFKGIFYEKGDYVKLQNALLNILMIFHETTDQIYLIGQEVSTIFSEKFQSYKILDKLSCYYIEKIE